MGPLPLGFLIGAIFGFCAVERWVILLKASDHDSLRWLFDLVDAVLIAILVASYLAGLAAAVHRPTRRLGFGMLIGVTLTFPVLFLLTFGLAFAIGGGQ